jgi:hypothetical protein
MGPKLKKHPPPMIIGCTAPRIGPHRLEIYLPSQLGDRPPATQKGNAFSPQPGSMENIFLLGAYHGSQ